MAMGQRLARFHVSSKTISVMHCTKSSRHMHDRVYTDPSFRCIAAMKIPHLPRPGAAAITVGAGLGGEGIVDLTRQPGLGRRRPILRGLEALRRNPALFGSTRGWLDHAFAGRLCHSGAFTGEAPPDLRPRRRRRRLRLVPSPDISDISMPSRNPRSATRTREQGQSS